MFLVVNDMLQISIMLSLILFVAAIYGLAALLGHIYRRLTGKTLRQDDRVTADRANRLRGTLINRWAARSLDFILFANLLVIPFSLFHAMSTCQNVLKNLPAFFMWSPFFVLWIIVETILLSTWGSTPGKWLFALSLTTKGGNKPDWKICFQRSLLVFITGVGLGNMILLVITELLWFTKGQQGFETFWDHKFGTQVQQETISLGKGVLIALVLVLIILMYSMEKQTRIF